ncbi:MAG: zinc ribbon domain-containing protein, partial [Ruminococcus sp.]|nr:zinc ribbon domain-containing protein [Ruminococcus sp.]
QEINIFSGMVYCADCGKPMYLHRDSTKKKEQKHMKCATYSRGFASVRRIISVPALSRNS